MSGHFARGFLSDGNRDDAKAASELAEEVHDCHALGGYDGDRLRWLLESNDNVLVTPGRKNQKAAIEYGEERHKRRGLSERTFGKLKESRRLVARHEKPNANFLGFGLFASIKTLLC